MACLAEERRAVRSHLGGVGAPDALTAEMLSRKEHDPPHGCRVEGPGVAVVDGLTGLNVVPGQDGHGQVLAKKEDDF